MCVYERKRKKPDRKGSVLSGITITKKTFIIKKKVSRSSLTSTRLKIQEVAQEKRQRILLKGTSVFLLQLILI